MTEPFDAWKASQNLMPPAPGHRRIWLHLFSTRADLAAWVGRNGGNREDFNSPWDAGAYTDDYDDVYCHEYPAWRNLLGIGTIKVMWHELRHIWLNGPDEDGVANDNDEHHHFLKCKAWGLCVGADHGIRLIDAHTGGVPKRLAVGLLAKARAAESDALGIRHGYVDVHESLIMATSE